jgi:hypothetical protein
MSAEEQTKAQVDELTQQTENIVLGWVVEDISQAWTHRNGIDFEW